MRKTVTRQGYMKFWRLGPIEFGEQSRWSRAPRTRGLWAFPYPFYDTFFTYHKYKDLLPKRLKESTYEEQEEWINTIGKKVLPIREFWYKGDVFTHFTPNGEIGDTGLFNPENTDWVAMDALRLNQHIIRGGGNISFERYGEENKLSRYRTSVDHLEVFIAPNMGTIREGKNPR